MENTVWLVNVIVAGEGAGIGHETSDGLWDVYFPDGRVMKKLPPSLITRIEGETPIKADLTQLWHGDVSTLFEESRKSANLFQVKASGSL